MFRWLLSVAVAIAMMPAICAGQGIEVPKQIAEGEPIVAVLVPKDIPDGALVRGGWKITDAKFLPAAQKNTIHIWAKPGKHVISANGVWVLTKDIKVGDQTVPVLVDFGQYSYEATFVVGEVKPDPPDPTPGPTPHPTPPGKVWVIIVEETKHRTPEQAKLFLDIRKNLNVKVAIADRDQNHSPSLDAYLEIVKEDDMPLPAMFVVTEDGTVWYKGKLPGTLAEIEKLVGRAKK